MNQKDLTMPHSIKLPLPIATTASLVTAGLLVSAVLLVPGLTSGHHQSAPAVQATAPESSGASSESQQARAAAYKQNRIGGSIFDKAGQSK